jgi:UDP-3-O-[3-hydroxymyristoyl] glucosamine N-acyltransferase
MGKFCFSTQDLKDIMDISKNRQHYVITGVSSPGKSARNSLVFFNRWDNEGNQAERYTECLVIVPSQSNPTSGLAQNNFVVFAEAPRKEYAIILDFILKKSRGKRQYTQLDNYIVVGENVKIGDNCDIEPFVFIDHDVTLGDHCIIKSGVRVSSFVEIGRSTTIRENTVVGGQGFGVERDGDGRTHKIPHLGGVVIGDFVEIGALNTIVSGTIDPTIIEDHVKTDDHVHVGHNCRIEKSVLITACAEISGSVTVGAGSTIGPNASIMNKATIGRNTTIGLGAVVTKSFPDGVTLAGSPADTIENVVAGRKALKQLISENQDSN